MPNLNYLTTNRKPTLIVCSVNHLHKSLHLQSELIPQIRYPVREYVVVDDPRCIHRFYSVNDVDCWHWQFFFKSI